MQDISNQSVVDLLTAAKNLKLEDWYVDRSLHEGYAPEEDLQVNLNLCLDGWAQARTPLNPNQSSGLILPINESNHASFFYHFPYDAAQPQMVDFDSCLVCRTQMLPASCLTDRNGQDYMTIGVCPDCGNVQQSRRPPRQWYAEFYRKIWNPELRQSTNWPEHIEPRKDPLRQVFAHMHGGRRVLEISTGWGASILAFKEAGFECHGIEATSHRSEFIRSRLGIDCFTGEAEALPIGTGPYQVESFDLIFSNHVLEHVYNTREVIEHVYPLLKENGLAFLAIPNYYQENLTQNTHDMSHTVSFSHANFLCLLQEIGFDLVRDFSTIENIAVLVRKAPAANREQLAAKMEWMSGFLPHRSLAYVLDKNGLARLPKKIPVDLTVDLKWFTPGYHGRECFVHLNYNFLHQMSSKLDAIRDAIRARIPLRQIRDLLPIRYVYDSVGVPMWYY